MEKLNNQQVMYEMYYYYDKDGKKLWTTNMTLALIRAKEHGTLEVYVEKLITDDK